MMMTEKYSCEDDMAGNVVGAEREVEMLCIEGAGRKRVDGPCYMMVECLSVDGMG